VVVVPQVPVAGCPLALEAVYLRDPVGVFQLALGAVFPLVRAVECPLAQRPI
jgi:hypothetical protein